MRVTQIHVRDALCVKEYAYQEDKNASCRQDMEDCTIFLTQITLLRMDCSMSTLDCLLSWMAMAETKWQSTQLVI
jgi:hypothetical protein